MLKHIVLLSGLLGLFTACGGGGGGSSGTNNPPATVQSTSTSSSIASVSSSSTSSSATSSSQTSSSSSSSTSIDPCNNTSGTIFSECLNTNYGFIVGSQYIPTYYEYIESTIGEQVQWSVVDSNSTHNKVLDVVFNDNNRQGQIVIGQPDDKPTTKDRSEFETGSLQFDLRVMNFGDAYNAQAGGVVFVVRMDCLWPCAAHETPIIIPTADTWTHVTLPISDLIATGLDISKVSASLVLVPRGTQANLHFQLDNVQLVKGPAAEAGPKVIYQEDFNGKTIPNWQFTNLVGNPVTNANTSYGFGAFLNINWFNTNDTLRFDTTLDKTIDIVNKSASFQINCWAGSAMNFSYQMVATDANGATETTDAQYGINLNPDQWYQVYADFGSVFASGFDAKHIRTIGLQFTYVGNGPNTTRCQVDTIRVTE